MDQRAALPPAAMSITPGYSWRLDLDVKFDGVRPSDWPQWTVRMIIWSPTYAGLKLTNSSGVTFEAVEVSPGVNATVPVIRLTEDQTKAMRGMTGLQYIIDLKAPGGEAEDYFAGQLWIAPAPPPALLAS